MVDNNTENGIKVRKRDGRLVELDKSKIADAIKKAMNKTEKGIDVELAERIAEDIVAKIETVEDVETIQDKVENKLMSSKRKDVAKEYIRYRNVRSEERERNGELMHFVSDVIDLKNMENENANMPEWVFTAKNVRLSSEISKKYALNYLLNPKVKEAFLNNDIYIHDFSQYSVGSHNCLNLDLADVLQRGFTTHNGDVRPPKSIRSAMQLTAVILQCASNMQFGGVAVGTLDFDLAPYVNLSFRKYVKQGFKYLLGLDIKDIDSCFEAYNIGISNEDFKITYSKIYNYALELTKEECYQSAEAFIHNLNTLQSRAGDQLPFTSVNFGVDTSSEGRMVTESILKATIKGIGEKGTTPIFPISIFQIRKGINDKQGTPNYDLKKLSIECSSKRIYPNFANTDAPHLAEVKGEKQRLFSTMG